MFIIGIKYPNGIRAYCYFVDDFVRICTEAISVTDLVFTIRKLCIKSYSVN